jgi:cytochrome d ubiquinol oxidase subunit I
VINVAIGVVTGLVQEFQFGMDWGAYSRLVGNIFGAPLAMEGLGAFFLESVFLGLWLFGWDKLSRRVHLWTIWAVAFGGAFSALFILAANSWMQHPVGYTMVNGKPQLNDIWALFTNPVFVWGYAKVLFAALTTGTMVMLAVSAWQLRRGGDRAVFGRSARMAVIVLIPAILFTLLIGAGAGKLLHDKTASKLEEQAGATIPLGGAGLIVAYPHSAAAKVEPAVTCAIKKVVGQAEGHHVQALKGAIAHAQQKMAENGA